MKQSIDQLQEEALAFTANSREEIEQYRIKFLGKKGILNDLFKQFKGVPAEQKKELGQKINQLKQSVSDRIEKLKRRWIMMRVGIRLRT
jgi:phenylalanyl-tRNA synthetase alpha chain